MPLISLYHDKLQAFACSLICSIHKHIDMKTSDKNQKKFIAVVHENQTDKINEIAEQLKKEGAKIDQVLSFTGIITGSTLNLQKLNKVDGVKSVEEDRENYAL